MPPPQSHKHSLSQDALRWIRFSGRTDQPVAKRHLTRQIRTARHILSGLYGKDPVPGMILGDEVGMGKTYVALAVVAALYRRDSRSRIVILAHNADMAKTWCVRWGQLVEHTEATWPKGQLLDDAQDMGREGLYFGSYETFKRVSTDSARAMLEALLEGSGIHEPIRRKLRLEIFGTRARGGDLDGLLGIPSKTTRKLFIARNYDRQAKGWKSWRQAEADIRRIVLRNMRSRRPIDLLIVDEAHKLESDQRTIFMSEVLDGRVRRALFVTATPFALDVEQLMDRLRDLYDATAWPGRDRKIQAVKGNVDEFVGNLGKDADAASSLRDRVEKSLGRYLVRSRWPKRFGKRGADRRSHQPIPRKLPRAITEVDAFAILALETAYRRIANCGERVHRASYRETLCSSYAAVRKTLKQGDIEEKTPIPRFLRGLADFIPHNRESLKFHTAMDYLVQSAREHQKIVVFCKRTATVEKMRRDLHAALAEERQTAAKAWRRVQDALPSWWQRRSMWGMTKRDCFAWLRFAVHLGIVVTSKNWKSVARMMHKHGLRAAGKNYSELLLETWGTGRRIDWVAELSGSTPDALPSRLSVEEQKKRGRTKDEVRFAFNLPGPPYVLVCTSVAREGIDLHHWCHKVLQYDLEWNPAWMEQQVGRVDRINSLAQRKRVPVEVYYAHLPGTYEERIADEVKRRCEMLRLVLGAGQWLADKPEDQKRIRDLDRYKLDFHPRGR